MRLSHSLVTCCLTSVLTVPAVVHANDWTDHSILLYVHGDDSEIQEITQSVLGALPTSSAVVVVRDEQLLDAVTSTLNASIVITVNAPNPELPADYYAAMTLQHAVDITVWSRSMTIVQPDWEIPNNFEDGVDWLAESIAKFLCRSSCYITTCPKSTCVSYCECTGGSDTDIEICRDRHLAPAGCVLP